MRKQIGGDLQSDINRNTQNLERIEGEIQKIKTIIDNFSKTASTGQTPSQAPVVTAEQQLSPEHEKAAKRAQIQANVDRIRACQGRNSKLETYNKVINTCGSLSNWGNTQDKVVPGVTMNGQNVICSSQSTGSVNDTFSSEIMGNVNQENLREALCQGKQQCKYNIPIKKTHFQGAKLATLENCQSAGKKTNKRKNKRSNKKSSRKQRAGNLCQQNKFPQLSLMNDKLNIYAPYPNNSGPFPAAAFTGNYRIDGPLSRGTTVPQAIHQVNLRKNVYPGGKTKKNKINRKNNRKNNKKSKRN